MGLKWVPRSVTRKNPNLMSAEEGLRRDEMGRQSVDKQKVPKAEEGGSNRGQEAGNKDQAETSLNADDRLMEENWEECKEGT